ncbi:MAG: respiratory nitrate reductase subunit beta [Acidimicrobiia bacterium]|nr:respiratory nitrate reductase subunit beta [Acidimicrobiia bacterium]
MQPETGPTDQVSMVFDLNKCMGCQTCSVACKVLWTTEEGEDHEWWMTVNTQPGLGTPKNWEEMGGGLEDGKPRPGHQPHREEFGGGWEFNYDEVFYGGKGNSAYLHPVDKGDGTTKWGMNWDEDQGGGEYPNAYYFYLPRLCNHCTRPVCAEACPTGAMYKRREDGIVLRNEEVCKGFRFCMEACPYKKIYYNYARHVSQHCIMCFPRLEEKVAPACARQCPGRLVFVGMLDDEEGPIHRLVHEWGVAMPLHPEFGTGPNIFYIPPLSPYRLNEDMSIDYDTPRIPPEYLESLFGPKVHSAIEKLQSELATVRSGGTSEMLDTLIAYQWHSLFGPFTQDPAELDRSPSKVAVDITAKPSS